VKDRKGLGPDPKLRDAIEQDAYRHGLILLGCGESTIRYIPPLNIPQEVLDAGLDVLEGCFKRAAR
jgi:4-aminobutyrate aminotransferase